MEGKIVAGVIAPHPPHLVYAESPPQNEPKAECGWEVLRWGYERLRKNLDKLDFDAIIVHSPHWQTYVGTHFLGLPHFKSLSVDPVFPNLFRYHYDLNVDIELSKMIHDEVRDSGLVTKIVKNPNFRIDYGTIISCHMTRPSWDKPIVAVSSFRASKYYNFDVMQDMMFQIGRATRTAIEKSGKRVVLLASHSLSHRHFTVEPPLPEDMSHEHIYHHGQYLWDMKIIDLLKKGKTREIADLMPDFSEQAMSETDSGSLSWLLAAMDFPEIPAEVHAYGSVIGTGNAIVQWDLS